MRGGEPTETLDFQGLVGSLRIIDFSSSFPSPFVTPPVSERTREEPDLLRVPRIGSGSSGVPSDPASENCCASETSIFPVALRQSRLWRAARRTRSAFLPRHACSFFARFIFSDADALHAAVRRRAARRPAHAPTLPLYHSAHVATRCVRDGRAV